MTRSQEILRKVSRDHKVGISDITGPLRFPYLVAARRDAIGRMRGAGLSLVQIAKALKRDYSTITHHCYPNVRAKRIARSLRIYHERKLAA